MFYDTTEAIYNSEDTANFEKEFLVFMNDLTVRKRANSSLNVAEKGKRVSMLTPSSKRRRTHGTAHMHYNLISFSKF